MRKITDFIINKRYLILVLFIIFAIISAILSTKVVINYDMANYLPSTSETRIGMDMMEKEFAEQETSSFNLMFKGITEEQKSEINQYLTTLEGIDSVEHDETEKYNKDDYTLYEITVKGDSDSELATNIYKNVTEKYKDYEISTSGDIANRNKPVLETWIIALAIGCAAIILTIMCESYLEVLLFLGTILIAVVLNKGTNIIFPSVSNITSSIAAILQLALSMDYSIMLMNRYTQEKEQEQDKVKAMKNALYHAFKSICSSSVTTIVGLIVLVFMSFTIGKDLGFVLAKGVLFSLISIFFVLPGLILMFDKWIIKTKKKTPTIRMNFLGNISYKFRRIAIPVFLLILAGSFLLKQNLGILYTNSEIDQVSKIFTENNQMAIIYKNKDEEKIAKLLSEIENEKNVSEVLGYSNTINEKLTYDKLNEKLNELGSDVDIEEYLLKIIYYNYYNKETENKMTFNEFVTFIKSEVYQNPKVSDKIDDETRTNINRLENFITENEINKKRTATEISQILEMDEDKIKDILIYYCAKNGNIKIGVDDFIQFINKDVLTNQKYASKIDKASIENLNKIAKFTNKTQNQTKMTSEQMANLFGMDKNSIDDLYKYYISINEIDTKMTLSEFANFVQSNALANNDNIQLLSTFSNTNIIKTEKNIKELSDLFGIDQDTTTKILLLKYMNMDNENTLTITEFIEGIKALKQNTNYLDNVDTSQIEQLATFTDKKLITTPMDKAHLSAIFNNIQKGIVENIYMMAGLEDTATMTPQQFIKLIINKAPDTNNNQIKQLEKIMDETISGNETKYTATQLAKQLNMKANQIYQIYALIDMLNGKTNSWKSSPYEFANLIIKNNKDEATQTKINLLLNIMNSSLNNTKYSYNELANFISMDSNTVKNVYTLYTSNITNVKLTPQEFVNFVLTHKTDKILAQKLSANVITNLQLVQNVMNGVMNNKKYTNTEISNLFHIDKEKTELLYGLYNTKYVNVNQSISLREFIDFLLNDVVTNKEYSNNFDKEKIQKLNTAKGIMNGAINGTKYTASEIMGIISVFTDSVNANTIDVFYIYYGSENQYNLEWELTIEEFVRYLNDEILTDNRFDDFIEEEMRKEITDSKETIQEAKDLLVGDEYSRIVINTEFLPESNETFSFIQKIKDLIAKESPGSAYIIGDSPMAYEMSGTFNNELNFITVLTMIAIFIVVAITFKSILIPMILVVIIQCAVYMTMGILSVSGQSVYFISILIVQSILMGATIDYAILYTSYYLEHRKNNGVKEAIINAYNQSIHTILTSSSILIIVTLIVANFASAIAAKICKTISEGTICSTILILTLLPAILATCDKFIIKTKKADN